MKLEHKIQSSVSEAVVNSLTFFFFFFSNSLGKKGFILAQFQVIVHLWGVEVVGFEANTEIYESMHVVQCLCLFSFSSLLFWGSTPKLPNKPPTGAYS